MTAKVYDPTLELARLRKLFFVRKIIYFAVLSLFFLVGLEQQRLIDRLDSRLHDEQTRRLAAESSLETLRQVCPLTNDNGIRSNLSPPLHLMIPGPDGQYHEIISQ